MDGGMDSAEARRRSGLRVIIYDPRGDPYKLNRKFATPDHTDSWGRPNPGDDLGRNSGRFPNWHGSQVASDAYMLEGRSSRLGLMDAYKEEERQRLEAQRKREEAIAKAKAQIIEAAYDAMLESCYNEGQVTLLSRYRSEFISLYAYADELPTLNDFLSFWVQKFRMHDR